jgi:hypothetical protein
MSQSRDERRLPPNRFDDWRKVIDLLISLAILIIVLLSLLQMLKAGGSSGNPPSSLIRAAIETIGVQSWHLSKHFPLAMTFAAYEMFQSLA